MKFEPINPAPPVTKIVILYKKPNIINNVISISDIFCLYDNYPIYINSIFKKVVYYLNKSNNLTR